MILNDAISLVPGTDEFWHYMTGARKVPIPRT